MKIDTYNGHTHRKKRFDDDDIALLGLSVRSYNALRKSRISKISQLINLSRDDLLNLCNIGTKSVNEIFNKMKEVKQSIGDLVFGLISGEVENIENKTELLELYNSIPAYRRNFKLSSYFLAFDIKIHDTLSGYFGEDAKVSDIRTYMYDISQKDEDTQQLIKLMQLLQVDIKQIIDTVITLISERNERSLGIAKKRAAGLTLEEIGKEFGLTRERVRQLEKIVKDTIINNLLRKGIKPAKFIWADTNSSKVLSFETLKKYLESCQESDFVFNTLFQYFSGDYVCNMDKRVFYHQEYYFQLEDVSEIILNFPMMIPEDKIYVMLSKACTKHDIHYDIMKEEFLLKYQRSEKIYHRGKLSLASMVEFILKTYYPSGIKLYDKSEGNRFVSKMKEAFGEDVAPKSLRALDARLADISVLCGRGMYIHPSHIRISEKLLDKIDRYIDKSKRTVLTVHELFETFKDKLSASSNVNNHYFLQGVISLRLGNKYHCRRSYISKDKNVSIDDELENFIKSKKEVHVSEVFSVFSGMSQVLFYIRTSGMRKIVPCGNGVLTHSDFLNIKNDDYKIKSVIEAETIDVPILSSKKLLEKLWIIHPEFLMRNNISSHAKLLGVMRYMFFEDFHFSYPYIARNDEREVTGMSILKRILDGCDSLSISELSSICSENHLPFKTMDITIDKLNDQFIRVDVDTIVTLDYLNLSDEKLEIIGTFVSESVSPKGYAAVNKIDDYTFYPNVGFEWNPFLLRGIVKKFLSDTIQVFEIPNSRISRMGSIFVSRDMDVGSYDEFLRAALKFEHNRKKFSSIEEAANWLKKEGLIINSLPQSLLENNFVYIDE